METFSSKIFSFISPLLKNFNHPIKIQPLGKLYQGNTFPFSCLTQFETLKSYLGIPGVRIGVFLWLTDHDIEIYLPIQTVEKMKKDGLKSFNIKYKPEEPYHFYIFPSKKKRG